MQHSIPSARQMGAVTEFLRRFGTEAGDLLIDLAPALNCTEADALADLLRAYDLDLAADQLMTHHAEAESPEEAVVHTHVAYPHWPGRLHDCPACEARCHCTPRIVEGRTYRDASVVECVYEGPDGHLAYEPGTHVAVGVLHEFYPGRAVWTIGWADKDVPGYNVAADDEQSAETFPGYAEASARADVLNREAGIDDVAASLVVMSSMRDA